MLTFPKDYFLGETRNDFYIEPMMKCAWAAQLEVLEVIREVCEKHNIQYFAAYGTLLGAVRHKGFIPWDDDVDIIMLRKDYERFWKVAPSELPGEYHVHTPYILKDSDNYPVSFGRVVNTYTVSYAPEQLIKYHGCPYIVGVDIFPYDTLPANREQEKAQSKIIDILATTYKVYKVDPDSVSELLPELEALVNCKIDRTKKLGNQLMQLIDKTSAMYDGTEGQFISHVPGNSNGDNRYDKAWFEKSIQMPFENISLPVPVNYDAVLKVMFGPDYMTPICEPTHDYPFYKAQAEALEKSLAERVMKGEKLF